MVSQSRRHYDHSTGKVMVCSKFNGPLLQAVFILYLTIRDGYDFKIYLDIDEDRDIAEYKEMLALEVLITNVISSIEAKKRFEKFTYKEFDLVCHLNPLWVRRSGDSLLIINS